MKILPVEKIREADAYTILHEPVKSVDLMERAAAKCFKWLKKRVGADRPVKVFCGTGNNGGDGLVIARLMAEYHADVSVYITRYTEKCTDDFLINYQRLKDIGSVECVDLKEGDDLPPIGEGDVVIDAIFGSGLSKPVKDYPAAVVRHINAAKALVVAIDMPSGLFSDVHTDPKAGSVIHADYTLTFQSPKLAFMFPENDSLVGEWKVLDIGLHPDFIRKADVKNIMLTRHSASGLLKHRTKFAHKGNFGHALLIAGGFGRMGAAVLASEACLRSGVGLLHTHVPGKAVTVIQTAVPEAMVTIDPDQENFTSLPGLLPFTAIGTGPGIGFNEKTKTALKLLIQNTTVPLVLDADAITILGENKTWISFIPQGSIR